MMKRTLQKTLCQLCPTFAVQGKGNIQYHRAKSHSSTAQATLRFAPKLERGTITIIVGDFSFFGALLDAVCIPHCHADEGCKPQHCTPSWSASSLIPKESISPPRWRGSYLYIM